MKGSLEDNYAYREMVKWAETKWRVEELRNMLVHFTTLRFPDLVSQAQKQAEQVKSPEQLRAMIDKLVTATTDQEARDALTN